MKFNFIFSLLVIFISAMLIGCGANPSSNDNISDDETTTVKPLKFTKS